MMRAPARSLRLQQLSNGEWRRHDGHRTSWAAPDGIPGTVLSFTGGTRREECRALSRLAPTDFVDSIRGPLRRQRKFVIGNQACPPGNREAITVTNFRRLGRDEIYLKKANAKGGQAK